MRDTIINKILVRFETFFNNDLSDWKILWEQSCIHNDTEITVSKDAEIIKGKYLGVNDLGELLLQNEKDEVISFSSGEVSIKGIYNR